MKKKLFISLLVVGVIGLIFGIGLIVKNKIDSDKKRRALQESIVEEYEVFKKNVEAFSDERKEIQKALNDIEYLTDLSSKYNKITKEYDKYGESLKKIEETSTDLKEKCLKNEFSDKDINNKVEAFITNYEQAFNYYIQDVEYFNSTIDEYNEWVKNTQVTNEYKTIKEYEPLYKEYVDVNSDGIFRGKKE